MQFIKYFQLFLISMLSYALNAQDYKLPPYTKFTLKNGLTVYLMEQHEVPMINVSVIVPSGAIYDGNKAGLASLTATALQHGTKNYPKSKLDSELDFIGASVNTYASKESATLTAEFAAKDKEKAIELIAEILIFPMFDNEEFNKEKKRVLVELEQAKEMPQSVINAYFDKLIFGDHSYGNIVAGTIPSVTAITTTELRNFYNEKYLPNGSAIAIAGDFNSREMKALITSRFAIWKKGKQSTEDPASQPIQKAEKTSVLLVNKNDANETTFMVGAPGISRNNPDFLAISVVNTAFGGRFTSWLNDALRVNSGLTYGASSWFNALKKGGTFSIATFTAKETTEAAIDLTLKVLDSLHKTGFDEKTIQSARNYVKGQFPPRYETSGQLANLMTQMFWYNFDESFINNFQKNVDEMTVEKAKSIITKYFPANKLQFVLIGKSDEIKKVAEKYGSVKQVEITEQTLKAF
jgi:zinc protease